MNPLRKFLLTISLLGLTVAPDPDPGAAAEVDAIIRADDARLRLMQELKDRNRRKLRRVCKLYPDHRWCGIYCKKYPDRCGPAATE